MLIKQNPLLKCVVSDLPEAEYMLVKAKHICPRVAYLDTILCIKTVEDRETKGPLNQILTTFL